VHQNKKQTFIVKMSQIEPPLESRLSELTLFSDHDLNESRTDLESTKPDAFKQAWSRINTLTHKTQNTLQEPYKSYYEARSLLKQQITLLSSDSRHAPPSSVVVPSTTNTPERFTLSPNARETLLHLCQVHLAINYYITDEFTEAEQLLASHLPLLSELYIVERRDDWQPEHLIVPLMTGYIHLGATRFNKNAYEESLESWTEALGLHGAFLQTARTPFTDAIKYVEELFPVVSRKGKEVAVDVVVSPVESEVECWNCLATLYAQVTHCLAQVYAVLDMPEEVKRTLLVFLFNATFIGCIYRSYY
jgi:tetratricopeptide (TPR) repeat protein